MRTKRTRTYIKNVADKYNISYLQAEEIIESFFRFTAESMKQGDKENMEFSDIRLLKFGVFKVKEGRRKHFEKLKNEKLTGSKK